MKIISKQKQHGFTLIEIMIVLALLGLVFSIVGRRVVGGLFRGQRQAAKIQIKQIEGDLDRYRLDCNFYPTTDQGMAALHTKPSAGRSCPNYDPAGYLAGSKNSPKDPWGTEYKYTSDDGLTYEIKSFGRDGKEGGEGEDSDISSADET